MRLLKDEPNLIVFGGTPELKLVGIGLILAGLAFGVFPLYMLFKTRNSLLVIPVIIGLGILAGGVMAVTHRKTFSFDLQDKQLRIESRNVFRGSGEEIPFSRIQGIRVGTRTYSSSRSGASHQVFVMQFPVQDAPPIEIDDSEHNVSEESCSSRVQWLAGRTGLKILTGE